MSRSVNATPALPSATPFARRPIVTTEWADLGSGWNTLWEQAQGQGVFNADPENGLLDDHTDTLFYRIRLPWSGDEVELRTWIYAEASGSGTATSSSPTDSTAAAAITTVGWYDLGTMTDNDGFTTDVVLSFSGATLVCYAVAVFPERAQTELASGIYADGTVPMDTLSFGVNRSLGAHLPQTLADNLIRFWETRTPMIVCSAFSRVLFADDQVYFSAPIPKGRRVGDTVTAHFEIHTTWTGLIAAEVGSASILDLASGTVDSATRNSAGNGYQDVDVVVAQVVEGSGDVNWADFVFDVNEYMEVQSITGWWENLGYD